MLASQITLIDHAPVLLDEDLALVLAAQHGSIAAFEALVKRHEHRMFRIAHNLLHNREDAEDAVQEAFLKAFHKLSQFQGRSKLSTWLARITVNQALSKLRREPVLWSSLLDQSGDESAALPLEIADWAPNPEMVYTASELREILEKNLRRLSPKLRSVFLLRDVEGLSLEEAAGALGLSVPAVKARSFRARLQLREWLTPYLRANKQTASGPTASKHDPIDLNRAARFPGAYQRQKKNRTREYLYQPGVIADEDHRERSAETARFPGDEYARQT